MAGGACCRVRYTRFVMPNWSFVAAVLLVPVLLVFRASTAERARETLFATVVASWVASTALASVFPGDPSDVGGQLVLLFGLLPLTLVPVATFVATGVARRPQQRVSAAVMAVAGWAVGLAVMILIPAYGVFGDVWDRAVGVLAPAVYASCGATYAATRPR